MLVATDAIGMGLNLNITRVVFDTMRKFDGTERRPLTPCAPAHPDACACARAHAGGGEGREGGRGASSIATSAREALCGHMPTLPRASPHVPPRVS